MKQKTNEPPLVGCMVVGSLLVATVYASFQLSELSNTHVKDMHGHELRVKKNETEIIYSPESDRYTYFVNIFDEESNTKAFIDLTRQERPIAISIKKDGNWFDLCGGYGSFEEQIKDCSSNTQYARRYFNKAKYFLDFDSIVKEYYPNYPKKYDYNSHHNPP